MDQAEIAHLQKMIEDEVRTTLPSVAVDRVALLQYGDDPVIEPGELLVRVYLAGEGTPEERRDALHELTRSFGHEVDKLRDHITDKLPEVRRLEFRADEDQRGPAVVLGRPTRSIEVRALAGGELTPVMARLGPTDLETLDTLITAGIASNRADAVRWALARIRERPAYARLRERALEIEELKAQF